MIHPRARPLITIITAALLTAAVSAFGEDTPVSRTFQLGEVLVVGGPDTTEGALGRVYGELASGRERADVAAAAGLRPPPRAHARMMGPSPLIGKRTGRPARANMWDHTCADQPRSVPPVAFITALTTLALTASMSASVNVFSRGCSVTSMARLFLPACMRSPR